MKTEREDRPYSLYHMDCIDFLSELPDGCVDLVLTDPPYGVAYKTRRRKDRTDRFCSEIANDRQLGLVAQAMSECYRVMKDDTAAYVFSSQERSDEMAELLRGAGFSIKSRIIWVKDVWTAGDLAGQFGKQWEMLILAAKGRPKIRGKRYADVWFFDKVKGHSLVHQNQKPVDLLERCVYSHSDEGGLVLDPFMGSGSTAVACAECGRRFMGCEIDDYYFDQARRRVSAAYSQGRLDLS